MQLNTGVVQFIDDGNVPVGQYSKGLRRINAALYRSYRCYRLIIDTIYSSSSRGLEQDFVISFVYS